MNNTYKKITADQIVGNVFKTIGDEWMLITAGNRINPYFHRVE